MGRVISNSYGHALQAADHEQQPIHCTGRNLEVGAHVSICKRTRPSAIARSKVSSYHCPPFCALVYYTFLKCRAPAPPVSGCLLEDLSNGLLGAQAVSYRVLYLSRIKILPPFASHHYFFSTNSLLFTGLSSPGMYHGTRVEMALDKNRHRFRVN